MKITWIGQGGFVIKQDDVTVMIDPYLSDSVERDLNIEAKRMLPINEKYLDFHPDVLICTHNHRDHVDPDTLTRVLDCKKSIQVLGSESAYYSLTKLGFPQHNYILFNRWTEVTCHGLKFKAVKATHSDPNSIGVIIEFGKTRIYVTGDTLYNSEIFEDIKDEIDMLLVCINGAGNNMNIEDAYRFTTKINPKVVIPMHYGMFPKADADPKLFTQKFKETIISAVELKAYEEIEF